MNKLLFLPLDINFNNANLNFELGQQNTRHQNFWTTHQVKNLDNHKWLLDQLSLDKVTTFTHKIQQSAAKSHVDVFDYGVLNDEIEQLISNEPSGFHVVLKGNSDSLEIFDGVEWVNPILPKAPIVYLMNLTSCYHRVKEDFQRETLYIKGFINKEKHEELINRSLEKYSHLAVYEK